jgi:hypothetical protein
MGAVAPVCREEGGAGWKETDMAGAVMVIVAEKKEVGSVTEVAVTVTLPPLGTTDGAV